MQASVLNKCVQMFNHTIHLFIYLIIKQNHFGLYSVVQNYKIERQSVVH